MRELTADGVHFKLNSMNLRLKSSISRCLRRGSTLEVWMERSTLRQTCTDTQKADVSAKFRTHKWTFAPIELYRNNDLCFESMKLLWTLAKLTSGANSQNIT